MAFMVKNDTDDLATWIGTIAADVFCVVFGLTFLWAVFIPH
jgi:hypothetical protein